MDEGGVAVNVISSDSSGNIIEHVTPGAEITASEPANVNDDDSLDLGNEWELDIAKDPAVTMALRGLLTNVFTPFDVVGYDGKRVPPKIRREISDIIDGSRKALQKALIDYLLRDKCFLYAGSVFNRLPYDSTFKERVDTKNVHEMFLKYTTSIIAPDADKWWDSDPEEKTVIIAPPYVHTHFTDKKYICRDSVYLTVQENILPLGDTIKKIVDEKSKLTLAVVPLMIQKCLIPTIISISKDPTTVQTFKKALQNWQNRTRVAVQGDPNDSKIEVISIGKGVPKELVEFITQLYASEIFMAFGQSINTVKASGQELSTSKTVENTILRIVRGFQNEVENWVAELLVKKNYLGYGIKFSSPNPDHELNELIKMEKLVAIKEKEQTTGFDFSVLIEKIFPSNEYGEIIASTIGLDEDEVDELLKWAETGKKGLSYINDPERLAELEKEGKKLAKIVEKLDGVGDKFGKESFENFVNWVKDHWENKDYDDFIAHYDDLLREFTHEEMDSFFLDYVAPAMNELQIYDDMPQDLIDVIKPHWDSAFGSVYSSYSQSVRKVLNDGVLKGMGEEDIKRKLLEVVDDMEGYKLQALAREELSKTYNITRAKKYWNDPVVRLSMEDEHVRDSHKKLHGVVFIPKEHPELIPPDGYGCRCFTSPYTGIFKGGVQKA
ncbi:minor capsid protein [Methanococcus maripaludis]|uniref:SPP1 gp7 family putative phage head morphogenesis protein n=1 Tax=Methanococcus maripaludis TaxID=39152 RepID=A0A8T4CLB3_METMI|nr:minor capsid protein [Methanococcus maripaludis]MBM7408788.1 SPP1 gp7 family putative phage head morphogenesis protein [Methanococcus maripaludis]MBP2219043.1 SPP1 gp7 family putative phage head morphogenesis protein [Methanococcus maripaludis]